MSAVLNVRVLKDFRAPLTDELLYAPSESHRQRRRDSVGYESDLVAQVAPQLIASAREALQAHSLEHAEAAVAVGMNVNLTMAVGNRPAWIFPVEPAE